MPRAKPAPVRQRPAAKSGRRGLSALLQLLQRGLVTDPDLAELYAAMRAALGVSGLAIVRAWGGMDSWNVAFGVPETWIRDHSRLDAEDPSRAKLVPSPPGTWWIAERDLTPADRRLEIFRSFRASGLADAAIAKLYNPLRDDLLVLLYRDDRKFRAAEIELLALLYPHLAGATATRRALALIDGTVHGAPPVVDVSFPGGTVSLDGPSSRRIERHLGPLDRAGWRRVEQAVVRAAKRFSLAHVGGRSAVLWPGLRIDFAVMPARPGETMRLSGFLLTEEEAPFERQPGFVPPLIEALLSKRQLAVARDFAAGMDVPGIAEAQRLSTETVRTHLRKAYLKLGVRGRRDLARALDSS
jgi:DNA-binding CsgD family transcriptional regulator